MGEESQQATTATRREVQTEGQRAREKLQRGGRTRTVAATKEEAGVIEDWAGRVFALKDHVRIFEDLVTSPATLSYR